MDICILLDIFRCWQQVKNMYYTFHINDSGALEYEEEIIKNKSRIWVGEMYDDDEFDNLNDILFSTHSDGFVINEKTLEILKQLKLPRYEIIDTIVKRKQKFLNLINYTKKYSYKFLKYDKSCFDQFHDWIDFKESDIIITKGKNDLKKLESHDERLKFIELNSKLDYSESYSFKTNRIVFNENFDSSIDLFEIPFYSAGIYVSSRFRKKVIDNELSDVMFSNTRKDINKIWKPHFPEIAFKK